ncbi:hypothetical protein BDV93DRAFT_610042, partial [Ceratobasidium sp. AG-I]
MNDLDALNLLHLLTSVSKNPVFQDHLKKVKSSKKRKPEWGKPIEELIPAENPPTLIDFDAGPPISDHVLAAIHLIQSNNPALPAPTCESFRIILRLLLDPGRLSMLNQTTLLSSCMLLLREHLKDTGEPMFCYEYGYLCFEVMVLTIQIGMICRLNAGGFDTFLVNAKKCPPREMPGFIALNTALQIQICAQHPLNKGMSWVLQTSTTPLGGMTYLPAVGGFTDVDVEYLLKEMWESRKQLSYIGSKVPTAGWSFVIQIIGEHLAEEDLRKKKNETLLWGFLGTLCHRYALVCSEDETDYITTIPRLSNSISTDDGEEHYVRGMEDEQDARTVVESYIKRMTPKPGVEPFSMHFSATLVDFVFQQEVSTLGETLVPLITVGYERIWAELKNKEITRDSDWCKDVILCMVNTLGATERLFGVEHKFKQTEIHSFFQALHDIDIIGLIGQILLMPTSLQPAAGIDQWWAQMIKTIVGYGQTLAYAKESSFAAKLFEVNYSDWYNTMIFVQHQILHESSRRRSLRSNAPGSLLAWTNVGKIFEFPERMQREKKAPSRSECANPRCAWVFEGVWVCRRCCVVEYCSRVCQNA